MDVEDLRPGLQVGQPNSTFPVSLPGLSSAGSRVSVCWWPSGLDVAPRVKAVELVHDLKHGPLNLVVSPAPSSNLAPPMASTSSKKMMQAFLLLAIWKSSLTIQPPRPAYFCTSSDPSLKQASVLLAPALASSVLPVPG